MSKLLSLKQDRVRRMSFLNKDAEKMVREVLYIHMYMFSVLFIDSLSFSFSPYSIHLAC